MTAEPGSPTVETRDAKLVSQQTALVTVAPARHPDLGIDRAGVIERKPARHPEETTAAIKVTRIGAGKSPGGQPARRR